MQENWTVSILRHKRENLKKCSLQPLLGHKSLSFFTYPLDSPLVINKATALLSLDGPPLSSADAHLNLILIDATWQLAEKMEKNLSPCLSDLPKRSLPKECRTAYPRRQTGCADPLRGLASVEALYIAFHLLGYPTKGLLDHYFWKEEFLALNRFLG